MCGPESELSSGSVGSDLIFSDGQETIIIALVSVLRGEEPRPAPLLVGGHWSP